MDKPRKIVVILGNGFDLDLGLKTSYKDFEASDYCPYYYPAPLIYHLNTCWPDNLDAVKWYDLENELLNFYKGISNPDNPTDHITEEEREFINSFRPEAWFYGTYEDKLDVIKTLTDKGVFYIDEKRYSAPTIKFIDALKEKPLERDRIALSLIKDRLCKYLKSLEYPENVKGTIAFNVLNTLNEEARKGYSVDIFTFNYTPVLINGAAPDAAIVHYMHGSCESEKIIIGTRYDSSINRNYDFLQKAFDSSYDPPALVAELKDADEVIIFGHSLGENDWQYFKAFFERQSDYSSSVKKRITIFTKDYSSEEQVKGSLNRMIDGNLSMLYNLNDFKIIRTGCVDEDQRKLYDFLLMHGVSKQYAQVLIGKLLTANKQ